MQQYEILLLLTPDNTEEDVEAFLSDLESQTNSLTVHERDFWGKKTLAQEVQNYKEGIYVVLKITANKEDLKEMETQFRMNTKVLRFLLLKLEQHKKSRYSSSKKQKEPISGKTKQYFGQNVREKADREEKSEYLAGDEPVSKSATESPSQEMEDRDKPSSAVEDKVQAEAEQDSDDNSEAFEKPEENKISDAPENDASQENISDDQTKLSQEELK